MLRLQIEIPYYSDVGITNRDTLVKSKSVALHCRTVKEIAANFMNLKSKEMCLRTSGFAIIACRHISELAD